MIIWNLIKYLHYWLEFKISKNLLFAQQKGLSLLKIFIETHPEYILRTCSIKDKKLCFVDFVFVFFSCFIQLSNSYTIATHSLGYKLIIDTESLLS